MRHKDPRAGSEAVLPCLWPVLQTQKVGLGRGLVKKLAES